MLSIQILAESLVCIVVLSMCACVKTGSPTNMGKFCVQPHPNNAIVYVNNVQMTECQNFPVGINMQISAHAEGFHDVEHSFIFHGTMTYDIYMEPSLLDEGILE